MKIIAKYSDYEIDSINFFINAISDNFAQRDIRGLTNDQVDKINVSKEHPLVQYMASALLNRNGDMERTGMIPCVSVTPGTPRAEMETLGEALDFSNIDDDMIAYFKTLLSISEEDLFNKGLLTKKQIESILSEYRKNKGVMRCQKNSWGYTEELNISCWSESSDYDNLLFRLTDSMLADMRVGLAGDDSIIKKMSYTCVRGLTNFNYGRVLYGSEINLTFFNRYNNYTIFTEDKVSAISFNPNLISPGDSK